MADRLSRASLISAASRGANTPIKAIINRIKQLASGYDIQEFDPNDLYHTDTSTEQILIDRKPVRVRRVYVVGCVEYRIGWVADGDLKYCMICFQKFGWNRFRHHCRACGALVCSKCSPYKADIIREENGSRVCRNCFGLKLDKEESPSTSGTAVLTSKAAAEVAMRAETPTSDNLGTFSVKRRSKRTPDSSDKWNNELFQFELDQIPKYEVCHRRMRELIPPDISKTNMKTMLSQNIPSSVAQRFWDTRVLWLICMHPDDINKVHIADLRSKYQAYGLDLVEMRAIWYCLRQTNWSAEIEGGTPKLEWKLGFKSKLDDLAHREAYGTLTPNEKRNPAYAGTENLKLFDAFKPIESRYARSASYFQDAEQSPSGSPRKALTPSHSDTDTSFDSISQISYETTPPTRQLNLLTDDLSDLSMDISPQIAIVNSDSSAVKKDPPSILTLSPKDGASFYNYGSNQSGTSHLIRRFPPTPSSAARAKNLSGFKTPQPGESPAPKTTMSQLYAQKAMVLDPSAVGAERNAPSSATRIPFYKRLSSSADKEPMRSSSSFSSQMSDSSTLTSSQISAAPVRAFSRLLSLIGAGKATGARELLRSESCPALSSTEASVLLLKCAEDPDSLAEPLDTFKLLVEEFSADINCKDASGRNLIEILYTNPFLGRYLMSKGADILTEDNQGWCALSMSFEFGVEWMYEAFLSKGEGELLMSKDDRRILKYISCLIIGGYCTRCRDLLATGLVTIHSALATELLATCRGNFENMKEPIETFELLESLGAEI